MVEMGPNYSFARVSFNSDQFPLAVLVYVLEYELGLVR